MRKSIFLKSIRSMWRYKKAYIACILVLTIGMAVFIGMLSASQQLDIDSDKYFNETRFADAFATVLGLPQSQLPYLKEIPGIKDVDGHLVKNATGIFNDESSFSISLVGIDIHAVQNMNIYSYTGTPLKQANDIWVGKEFLDSNHLNIGDKLSLIINGKIENFTLCGYIESPEYLLIVGDASSNKASNTFAFIQSKTLENLFHQEGVVTNLSFQFDQGTSFVDLEKPIKNALKNDGILSVIEKTDQFSYATLKANIATLASIATMIPFIFLLISIIMLYIMLKRFIEQERSQIGTLKAFGYLGIEIVSGYCLYGLVIGCVGFIMAMLFGTLLGNSYYNMMINFFYIPNAKYMMSLPISIVAFLISVGVSLVAVLMGAKGVMEIHPAEAMRAAAPEIGKTNFQLNGKVFQILLNPSGIMGVRGVFRNKRRSLLTIMSIVMCFFLTNTLFGFTLSFQEMINSFSGKTDLYDLQINYNGFEPFYSAISDIQQHANIKQVEGLLKVPVTLKNKQLKKDVVLTGQKQDATLTSIVNENFQIEHIPAQGLLLNSRIATELDVKPGDVVEIESPYLKNNAYSIVSRVFTEPIGSGCYMTFENANMLFGENNVANTIVLNSNAKHLETLEKDLKYASGLKSIVNKENLAKEIATQSGATTSLFTMLIIMSFFMCLGVVYNVSRISLAEKQRELATMRILGFTTAETAEVNAVEHWTLFIIGCVLGFILSTLLQEPMSQIFSSNDMSMTLHLSITSTISATICCMIAVIISNFMGKQQIKKYQLVEVLKERE